MLRINLESDTELNFVSFVPQNISQQIGLFRSVQFKLYTFEDGSG